MARPSLMQHEPVNWSRSLLLLVAVLASGLSAPVIRYAAATPLAIVAWHVIFVCPPMFALGVVRSTDSNKKRS